MNRRDAITAGLWATGTLAVTLGLFYPTHMLAVDPPRPLKAENAKPKLVVNGSELSIAIDGQTGPAATLLPGKAPVLRLLASNPTETTVDLSYRVSLSMSPPVDLRSRTLPSPKEVWHCEELLTLRPGESKTLELDTKASLDAGTNGHVRLEVGKQEIVALRLAVPRPDAKGQTPGQVLTPPVAWLQPKR